MQAGTDTDVTIVPTITTTTSEAREDFTPDKRGCYFCDEVGFKYADTDKIMDNQ